ESFVDLDLDLKELGGDLTWTQALDDTQVTQYNVYLGIDCIENVTTLAENQCVRLVLDQSRSDAILNFMSHCVRGRDCHEGGFGEVPASVLYVTVRQACASLGSVCRSYKYSLQVYPHWPEFTKSDFCCFTSGHGKRSGCRYWTAMVVELVAAGVDSAVVATSLVVVNFARVTVQLVGADQLPSVLPSFSTVFNVTNETEDDVVDIDNDSSAVRTTLTTTDTGEDTDAAWLHCGTTCRSISLDTITSPTFVVNETDVGEDSDVPARRLSSVGSNATEVSDSQELIALLNFTRTRLIFCAQRQLLGSLPMQATTFHVPAETQLGNATHLLIYAESAYAESSIASGGTRVEDAEASVVNVTFADEDLDVSQLGGYIRWG
ncbi:unnamed protein product, partial [Symbiodinium sp. CCMP2456]